MTYYAAKNLNTPTVQKIPGHPSNVRKTIPSFQNKTKFREWCILDTTDHCFYSTFEALNPNQRVSGANPAHKMSGFVADYDGDSIDTSDMAALTAAIKAKSPGGWAPTWVTKTRSGKARAVWEFEQPLLVDNDIFLDKLMDSLLSETKAKTLIKDGGWDSASRNPAMLWELGTDWTPTGAGPIRREKLEGLFYDIAKKTTGPRGKVHIPMEVLAEKVRETFPGRWSGEFDVGARGPLFWIDDGIDRVGCIVQPGGVWCYSTRSPKSFVTWSDIFGESFVKDYRDKQLAEAVSETWFDGKKYWVKDGRGVWSPIIKEDFILRLRLAGFSHNARKKGDPASEIDEVLGYVQDHRRIHGAAPFLFNFEETVQVGAKRYINTHAHLRPLQPNGSGDEAKWPHLFDWFNGWMDDPKSCAYVMAWLQRFYSSSLKGQPKAGHSLIVAGDADKGKSLFSTFLLPTIFNGGADAGRFLMGHEAFNKELSESPVWYVDDNTSGATSAEHRRFSEMLKKLSATPKVTVRAMYSEPVDIERRGRIVLTTNTDADSLAILPNLDGTILDKLMVVKMSETHVPWFNRMPSSQIEEVIRKELPHFLTWLLDYWRPPPEVTAGASGRYGINTYHHPGIISLAKDLSADQRDLEMLHFWWDLRADKKPWTGNLSSLLGTLGTYDELQVFTRNLNKVAFGRTMSKLASQNPKNIEKQVDGQVVTYKIQL